MFKGIAVTAAVAAALLPATAQAVPTPPIAPPLAARLAAAQPPAAQPPAILAGSAGTADRTRAFWTAERMRAADAAVAQPGPASGKPWRGSAAKVKHIGRLFMLARNGKFGTCTAAVVDAPRRNVLATAAHCVYNHAEGGWMERVLFVPGYRDGAAPYGSYPVESAAVAPEWTLDHAHDADYTFLTVHDDGTGRRVQDVTGGAEPVFKRAAGGRSIFGYPVELPYDGARLQYCTGRPRILTDPLLDGGEEIRPCRLTQGASGGPWYDPRGRQTGVSSGRPVVEDPERKGVVLDDGADVLWSATFDKRAKGLYEDQAPDQSKAKTSMVKAKNSPVRIGQ
ncbi:hypothetical protein G5C51_32530 [Streptomyces sp. A7024]|uniref:Serine protease n=1 Tax=Streptomyces coryli TaxID=1128680 RepID=A0A6G4UB48_9ACTN|nr:hypothetical protein [Streptomyces coryli]NGN68608.1 hypothetical protein [Streptomyces coryli]